MFDIFQVFDDIVKEEAAEAAQAQQKNAASPVPNTPEPVLDPEPSPEPVPVQDPIPTPAPAQSQTPEPTTQE